MKIIQKRAVFKKTFVTIVSERSFGSTNSAHGCAPPVRTDKHAQRTRVRDHGRGFVSDIETEASDLRLVSVPIMSYITKLIFSGC